MGRLIVVSNRVQPPDAAGAGATGGLAVALSAALREYSGLWFGWSGETVDAFTGHLSMRKVGGVTLALMDLDEHDVHEYYNGYANRTLWPLFHYRTDLVAYERSFDEGYARVNARFAESLLPLIEPDDLIWVQDYHLLPLARALRRRGARNPIGFFLHIPWPARQIFTTLPRHAELVEALFDYDLIGFQTADSLQAFADYVKESASGEVRPGGVAMAFGKRARIGAFPIGIDVAEITEGLKSDRAKAEFERVRASLLGRKMILGVDRLDYSKGLEERFLAYEQYLEDHPEGREHVFLLQIATPTRDEVEAYQDIRGRLESLSGRINGAYADVDWVPVRYVNKTYRRDALTGIYHAAHVALVTPLRDGMNLVAKEYVAAQDPDDPGVLVLSEQAGAAEQMREALIVNPFNREAVAEAIRRGLAMPLAERKDRWQALFDGVSTDDVAAWRDSFVAALKNEATADQPLRASANAR